MTTEIDWETETALQFLIRLDAENLHFRTQLKELNAILSLVPGRIYEIDGDVGVGKTQICYSLAARFLETRKTARIGWISAISLRTDHLSTHFTDKSQEHAQLFHRIMCKSVEKVGEFKKILDNFWKTPNLSLVFVEDVDALLHDTVYDKDIGKFVQEEILERLRKLARIGITVVVTNHITHWRGYPSPALGAYWTSQITNRLFIDKREDGSDVRVISTMDPEEKINDRNPGTTEIQFRIGGNGLEAVEGE